MPHRDELVEQVLQGLRERIFDSRAFLRPAAVKRIATDEVDAYFAFLEQPDSAAADARGAHLCDVGLGERAILGLGRTVRQWCYAHLSDGLLAQGLEIAETYHSALVQGFIQEKQDTILDEQERIRAAIQKTVGRQTLRMELAADVARVATSILDLDELLTTSVDLIVERFGFYYAGVFLVDEYGEWAVLRAGSGEPGRKMLRRGHKLRVGGDSMIGWCAAHGEPRIAINVGEEAVHFDNPYLPETRSEMAIPLSSRGEIVGAMTIQSRHVRAFSDEDVTALRTVADQLANAVKNARLFAESQTRTEELEVAYRRHLREEWTEFEAERKIGGHVGYTYDLARASTSPADEIWTPEMEQAVEEGRVVAATNVADDPGNGRSDGRDAEVRAALAAPITLRGENIGALSLYEVGEERQWSEDDIALVETVSAQAALALENARLFEEAQTEAQRRALINEVIQSASTAPDPKGLRKRAGEVISRRLEMPSAFLEWNPQNETFRLATVHDPLGLDVTPLESQVLAAEMAPRLVETVSSRELNIFTDLQTNTRGDMNDFVRQLDLLDAAMIPLTIRAQVWGVLILGRQRGHPPIDEGERSFLRVVAANLSVALENAHLYQEAVETAERLKEVDRLKSQFLANMSHELRTPLNSIIGFSRVILKGIDGPITQQQEEDLKAIHNSGQHLLGLINDVLDISKIEAGKLELSFEPVDLADLVKGVMATAIALVKEKPIELQQSVPADLPLIRADERRVRQVLLNLVSNAAKFTEEGFIRVAAEVDAEDYEVIISVTDSGPGIPQEKVDEIFEPFTQVDATSTRKHGGTGLGLTISSSFIELHGGQVWVESELDVGSTFYFSLPIEGPPAAEEEEEDILDGEFEASEGIPGENGKLILCVDDDEGVIQLFRRYLRKQGYQVIGLTDATQVAEEAKYLQPHAITLDVMMPKKDGWQVIQELKADPETRHIPVIICSIVSERDRGLSLGASDYLVKPIMEEELLAALDRLDREAGRHRVLVVDDHEEDRELLRRLIESQEGYEVTEATGGQEAIALVEEVRPHIIILDLMMPEVDGFAVLEAVKGDETIRSTPVIVVTAKELTEEDRRRLNHRVETLVQKGVLEQQELLEDVAAALRKLDRSPSLT